MNRTTILARLREFEAYLKDEKKYSDNPWGGVTECAVDEAKCEKAEDILERFQSMFKSVLP